MIMTSSILTAISILCYVTAFVVASWIIYNLFSYYFKFRQKPSSSLYELQSSVELAGSVVRSERNDNSHYREMKALARKYELEHPAVALAIVTAIGTEKMGGDFSTVLLGVLGDFSRAVLQTCAEAEKSVKH